MSARIAVLDVNETLFSLDPVAEAFAEVGLDASDLGLWFARILRDGFAATAAGDGVSFPTLARHHVQVLADESSATTAAAGEAAADRVVAAFDRTEPHRDVAPGLRLLADAGVRSVAFTNGSASIVQRFLDRSGLHEHVEQALDVTAAGVWKPHPDSYRWLCDKVGVPPSDAVMVAVHPWDVAGAMRVGMTGAWVDRDHRRWPAWLPRPDVSAVSFTELCHALTTG